MAERPDLGFAGLLRRLRDEAQLTQEELAEAAGLSPRSVSDLERGIHRTAHKDTAVLLAARSGIGAAEQAVGDIARLCGYLPLAIGILASQLRHHPARTTASVAADLAAARDRLAVMRAEDLSVAAAFDLSYADLTSARQRLFRRLGLVPGPSVDAYAAAALDGTSPDAARRHLDELYDQHLLTEPAPGRYALHDLLRAHARALTAADDPAESDAATGRLLDYYLHTARAADRHISSETVPGSGGPQTPQAYAPDLATLDQAAAWLETELPNLHAAVHAAVSGWAQHAVQIPAAMKEFLFAHGQLYQAAALRRIVRGILRSPAADSPARAASASRVLALGQADALSKLALLKSLTGDHLTGDHLAAASYQQVLALARLGDQRGQAHALHHLGLALQRTGHYSAAAACLQRAADLFCDLGHRLGQARTLNDLGVVHQDAVLATILLLAATREDDHVPRPRRRSILLSQPANAAGVPSSESRVKRGNRVVGIDTELVEKLGRNDLCPCGSGRRFPPLLAGTGRFDGVRASYYIRDL